MLFTNAAITICLLGLSSAVPIVHPVRPIDGHGPVVNKRQAGITDVDIAQYALTLEHLENHYYKQAVSKWPLEVFTDAGYTPFFYDQLKYITHDEEAHVVALTSLIQGAGADPVQACTYDFGYALDTPQNFIKSASVIEGVGVSAYLGAAADISSKSILTAAGSILVTESIHQAALRNAAGEIPMANVFGTPMGINAVYSIASSFIVSCPSTNAPLPVMAYKALNLYSGLPTASGAVPGAEIDVSMGVAPEGTVYGTFVSGLDIIPVEASHTDGDQIFFIVPENIGGGQSYVFLTNDNSGNLTDSTIIAGPVIIEITPNAPTFDLSIQ